MNFSLKIFSFLLFIGTVVSCTKIEEPKPKESCKTCIYDRGKYVVCPEMFTFYEDDKFIISYENTDDVETAVAVLEGSGWKCN